MECGWPQSAAIHRMQRENDLSSSYSSHTPLLRDMFENLYRYVHERDDMQDNLVDAFPMAYATGFSDRGMPSLHATEFKHWIWDSKLNDPADMESYIGPFFKIHRVKYIECELPSGYDVDAHFNTGYRVDTTGATTGDTIQKMASAFPVVYNGSYVGYGHTAYSTTAATAEEQMTRALVDQKYLSSTTAGDSSFFGVKMSMDSVRKYQRDAQCHSFNLDFDGEKVHFDDAGFVDPTATTPVANHSPFGLCQKDLRLGVISTHSNQFWRMKLGVGVRFRG